MVFTSVVAIVRYQRQIKFQIKSNQSIAKKETELIENKVAPGIICVKCFRGAISMLLFKKHKILAISTESRIIHIGFSYKRKVG